VGRAVSDGGLSELECEHLYANSRSLYQIGRNRENHEFLPRGRLLSAVHCATMNWNSYLQRKTRDPAFLWRMVIWIIALGVVTGFLAQYWLQPQAAVKIDNGASRNEWHQIEQLAEQGEWGQVWWSIPERMLADLQHVGPTMLAVFAGCCWFAFLLQTLEVTRLRDQRLWLALAAVGLGALSVWPTLFLLLWQEVAWELNDSRELMPGLRYNILGVGLREELAKLCCLLPLMPFLLRQRNELVVLLVSACVGLGFAIEENIGYFSGSQGQAAIGRFLTANPFHMTLTGLIGLAVYRGLRYPRDWGPHALATFGLMVFAHGIYDAAISLPALADYSIATTIIFALVVYQFFHELRELRTTSNDTISLTATFLCGVSLVTSATFVYLSATLGSDAAFDTLFNGILSMSLMVYLFLREMPETLVHR